MKTETRPFSPPRKVTMPLILKKDSKSFSPHLRKLNNEEVDSAKLIRKYKQQRIDEQNCEIQLTRFVKQLEEGLEGNSNAHQTTVVNILLGIVEISLRFLFFTFRRH